MTDEVLADQVDYYRRRAGEYDATAYGDIAAARNRIARLIAEMRPTGSVLEIACGTGLWAEALAGLADTVTAIDAAPEVVEIASDRVRSANVSFEVADVFSWTTDARFDVIFFSAWLSHVPTDRFEQFWQLLRGLLQRLNCRGLCLPDHSRRACVTLDGHGSRPGSMRYPDGGGLSAAGRARRERVRLAAVAMYEQEIKPAQVAHELRVSTKSAYQWRRRWRVGGTTALASRGAGGAACRLSAAQLARLRAELDKGPAAWGWREDQRWTLERVTTLIGRLFHVRYTLRGTSYLLHRIGFTPQVPAHRAAERDEAAIAAWRDVTWVKLRG